ncbi:hypothetical protein [Hyalangium minutum]|uniref:Uncharacterized protein n=1 Tax=Hyalangium minutum TaxID=394096 RepID=A0A085WIL5_9BACT|nr:hypothetical protein [Hyalangium minutum]KFE67528.1 hypothetical protein DB31_8011 [Hyalangium minutum]
MVVPRGAVFAVGAYREDGVMVGGTRVHLRTALTPLPIERCVQEPLLAALILSQLADVPAEFCGVWVDREVAHSGAADFVFLGAAVACRVLGSKQAYGFAHKKVLPFYQKYGLHFDTTRSYTYPDERYVSYAAQVDLGWSARADHPACGTYRAIQRAFTAGQAFEFKPESALTWEPPLAEVTPWLSALPWRGAPLPETYSVQNPVNLRGR